MFNINIKKAPRKRKGVTPIKTKTKRSENEMLFSIKLTEKKLDKLRQINYKGNSGKTIKTHIIRKDSKITRIDEAFGSLFEEVNDWGNCCPIEQDEKSFRIFFSDPYIDKIKKIDACENNDTKRTIEALKNTLLKYIEKTFKE